MSEQGPLDRRRVLAGLFGQAGGLDRRRGGRGPRPSGLGGWLADPRNTVLILLAAALVLGGGRKWLQARRARAAVGRLDDPQVTPDDVEAAADHGRPAILDLFRLLGTADDPAVRAAAGRALAALWKRDELVPEEEKSIVRRGFTVTWRARRRYPGRIRGPIPVHILFGVPFLERAGAGIEPENLEWSHRVLGAEQASLEQYTAWHAGPGRARVLLEPADFTTPGPHRLVLQARVRTRELTSAWELELPHMPFSFELDPNLAVEALLALPDEARAAALARAVALEPPPAAGPEEPPRHLALNDQLLIRDPPWVAIRTPLPCDLAHAAFVELEGVPGRFGAGQVILSGQGTGPEAPAGKCIFPLGPIEGLPADAIDRTGERGLRVVLEADPHRGWADPDVRSIWPGTLTTDWLPVRVIRR